MVLQFQIRRVCAVTALLIAFGAVDETCFCATTNDITGSWLGTLQIGQAKLRVQFRIGKTPEGALVGKMDSLDQGATMLVEKVTYKDDKAGFYVNTIEGIFQGTMNATGTKIAGTWSQAGQNIPLTLDRAKPGADPNAETLSPADLAASKKAAEKISGEWNGTLSSADMKFRLVLNITTNASGAASGTMDSVDQGLRGIPLSGITYKNGKVHFDARGLTAFYEGVSFNNSTTITGQWHQAEQVLPLSFKKSATSARK